MGTGMGMARCSHALILRSKAQALPRASQTLLAGSSRLQRKVPAMAGRWRRPHVPSDAEWEGPGQPAQPGHWRGHPSLPGGTWNLCSYSFCLQGPCPQTPAPPPLPGREPAWRPCGWRAQTLLPSGRSTGGYAAHVLQHPHPALPPVTCLGPAAMSKATGSLLRERRPGYL